MKALYSGTSAPMTFKLHRLMVPIGSTTHTEFGITKSKVKVTGLYFNFLYEGPLLGNYCTHDLELYRLMKSPQGHLSTVVTCLVKLCPLFGLRNLGFKFCMQVDVFSIKTEMASKLYTNVWGGLCKPSPITLFGIFRIIPPFLDIKNSN